MCGTSRILDNEWFKEHGNKIRKWKIKRGYISSEATIEDVLGLIGHIISEVTIYKLITLGKNIKLLGGAEKLPNSLITMIKNPREHHKAYVEIKVASCIAKDGFQVELHPISKPFLKVPDIKAIINNKEVYIEVIVLEWLSEAQKELSKIIRPIRNELPNNIKGEIRLKHFPSHKDIKEILEEFKRGLGEPSIVFETYCAKVDLKKVESGGGIMISGPPSSEISLGPTYMKRVLRKYKQLPKGAIGVIVADLPTFLAPNDIEDMVKEAQKSFSFGKHRVAGIITTHKLSEAHGIYIGLKASPLLFIVSPAEKAILDRLASSLSSFR